MSTFAPAGIETRAANLKHYLTPLKSFCLKYALLKVHEVAVPLPAQLRNKIIEPPPCCDQLVTGREPWSRCAEFSRVTK